MLCMCRFDKVKYWLWPHDTCGKRVLGGAGLNSLDKAGQSLGAEGIPLRANEMSSKLLEVQASGQATQEELKES